METLAKHHAEDLIDALHKRERGNELVVGPENDSAATLVITRSTPDEALLAVLDLDITAPELRGNELRWDRATQAWRPVDALSAEPDQATDGD